MSIKNSCSKPRKGGCHSNGGCCEPNKIPRTASLQDAIRYYLENCYPRLKKRLKAFKDLDFPIALEKAALAKEVAEYDKRLDHLRRVTKTALNQSLKKLKLQSDEIENSENFDKLFQIVDKMVAKTKGLGPMYAYDVALRIGGYLEVYPEVVYLQRGVRVGAEKLLGRKCPERTLPCSTFTRLKGLNAMGMEDFLCIFKDHPALGKSE